MVVLLSHHTAIAKWQFYRRDRSCASDRLNGPRKKGTLPNIVFSVPGWFFFHCSSAPLVAFWDLNLLMLTCLSLTFLVASRCNTNHTELLLQASLERLVTCSKL